MSCYEYFDTQLLAREKMIAQVREQQQQRKNDNNNNIWVLFLFKRACFDDFDVFVNVVLPLSAAQPEVASMKYGRRRVTNDRKRQMTLTENRRRLVVRELTHLISKPNIKIKPRITSDAVVRVLTRFKRELRAMEMESRHAWATMAQLVAAVRPHILNLRDNASALRARHEFFVEKTSSEPEKYLNFAEVSSSVAARDMVLDGIQREMQNISLMMTTSSNNQHSYPSCGDVFMNANLSSLIWRFLDASDLRNCGLVSKSLGGARELGKLMTVQSSLQNAYGAVTKDFTWLEHALLLVDGPGISSFDSAIHECIFSQRKVADCIVQTYALYLPTADRKDDYLSLASTSPVSNNHSSNQLFKNNNNGVEDGAMQSSSSKVNRGGLLVRKRKEFGGKEEVPNPT